MKSTLIFIVLAGIGQCLSAQQVHSIKVAINQPATCDQVLGIDLNDSDTPFRIYPIPSTDKINIESPWRLQQLEVLDFSGKVLLSKVSSSVSEKLDVSNLQGGIYLLRMQAESKVFTYRILISK